MAIIIAKATEDLPADMPLKDRKAAVNRARPHWASITSHAEKSWQAARRDYLVRFGYVPMTKAAREAEKAGLPLFDEPERGAK
ncbi:MULTISPECIES: hypothetical protein [Rhodovulum]|uniref:hypothetical protein n=1 Tax=Rhodovulum TaxID=34008 RepID=UPI000951A5FF|nr:MULTISPECIES: hypothetical protein [Rhodovulum]ARC90361.1 hypothetical protein B5V46_18035 [Rhodovulum sp. MB263]MBL3563344.1 hypothetical protein [Rhodovulum sulfidophilum]OLS53753.1 hypothetical protein BV392_18380 [Rhodovulum sulfidophilum]